MLHRIAGVDTPHRTAAAFGLGVFLSFSPFLGVQMALGFGTAFLLRLSRVAVFAGLCTNLPWLMVPWYAFTTAGAALVLGTPIAPDFEASLAALFDVPVYQSAFWTQAGSLLAPFLWSFLLGSTTGAAALGLAAFVAAERVIARRHRHIRTRDEGEGRGFHLQAEVDSSVHLPAKAGSHES